MQRNDAVDSAFAVETNTLTIEPEEELESAFETGETDEELPETDETRRFKTEFRRQSDSEVVDWVVIDDEVYLSMDSASTGDWITRVPATRRAVLAGERLWLIPLNWEHVVRITDEDEVDETLYRIPDSGLDIVVSDLKQGPRATAGYQVESVGTLTYEIEDMPDKSALRALLADVNGDDEIPVAVRDGLQEILERWDEFESHYRSWLYKWGTKGAGREFQSEDDSTLDEWLIRPWDDEQSVSYVVGDFCGLGREDSRLIDWLLMDAEVVMPFPALSLEIQHKDWPPVGYRLVALLEAGCSPAEAVAYLLEQFSEESYHTRDSVRSVDGSVTQAKARSAELKLQS